MRKINLNTRTYKHGKWTFLIVSRKVKYSYDNEYHIEHDIYMSYNLDTYPLTFTWGCVDQTEEEILYTLKEGVNSGYYDYLIDGIER